MVDALKKVKPLEEHSWMETLLVPPRGPTVVEDITDKTERELVLFAHKMRKIDIFDVLSAFLTQCEASFGSCY